MSHCYRIYDEWVASDRPLEYITMSTSPPSWSLSESARPIACDDLPRVHEEQDYPGGPVLCIDGIGKRSVIDYGGWRFECTPREALYTAEAGCEVPFAEVVERVVAPWMVLNRRPQVLALHGGAVSHAKRAWVFMGEGGVGKSSAALGLVRRGALLLSDDMALVDVRTMNVLPGAWTLRMWGDVPGDDVMARGVVVGTSGGKHRFKFRREESVMEGVKLEGVIALRRDELASPRGECDEVRGARALALMLGQCFDVSEAPAAWSTRRLALARELVQQLGGVKCLRYATSAHGEAAHVEGLWEVLGG